MSSSEEDMPCPECGGEIVSTSYGQGCKNCDWCTVYKTESVDYKKNSDMDRI